MSSSLCPYHGNAYNPGPCGVCEFILINMTNPPQNITSRYARNLLVKGENNEYTITSVMRRTNMIDDFTIGYYYTADIVSLGSRTTKMAVGVTPEQAVNRCLAKHGVTFR